MKKITLCLLATALTAVLFVSCSKDKDRSTLQVRLTDAPTSLEEVNVEIEEVRVKMYEESRSETETPVNGTIPEADDRDEDWIRLETNGGIYNLLELQNGVEMELASVSLPKGIVKEIRLILGSDNSVKENGVVYPLTIPSGSSSGLKIKIDKQLNAAFETVLIDFDAALSVKKEGTGDYKLRPVLRLK